MITGTQLEVMTGACRNINNQDLAVLIQGSFVQNFTKLLANVTLIFFIMKYGKYLDIFAEKKIKIYSHFFSAKISSN